MDTPAHVAEVLDLAVDDLGPLRSPVMLIALSLVLLILNIVEVNLEGGQ